MVADRGAVLLIRAASRGVIDFSKCRVLDIAWWRKVNAVVQSMATEDELVGLKAALQFQCALVGNGTLTNESFDAAKKTSQNLLNSIFNLTQPWAAKSISEVKTEEIQSLVDLYKQTIGDPDDPEFRKKLEADLARLESDRLSAMSAVPEDDMARIDRLMREQDARRRGR